MSRSATEQPSAVWCCSVCGAIYHKDFPRCPADGAEVVVAERDPLLGAAVGHYAVDKLIGEGGMGRVYLAHHANLPNKHYAVKVLLGDHSASPQMRTRFTREAERASQLDHPNVVPVVDFGQTPHGLLYIVMDYVEGRSLVSLIDDGPMPPARVISLARAICKGLVYAHAAGIVHRDLKPENILVSTGPEGEVPRIADFGLAMSLDHSDARLTESGMTMGTPAFAAPEQLSGKPIDHRADLFALGMTMFEMLTGGLLPFEGTAMEMVSAKTTKDAPRISERAPALAVPREIEDIVTRLTRRNPAERYPSARAVIEALDAVHLGPEARLATEVDEPESLPREFPRAKASRGSRPAGARPSSASESREASKSGRWRTKVAGLAAVCGLAAAAWYLIAAKQRATTAAPAVPARVAAASAGSTAARSPVAAPMAVAPVPVAVAPAPVTVAPVPVAMAPVPDTPDAVAPASQASVPTTAGDPGSKVAVPPERAPAATPAKHHHRQRVARPAAHVEPVAPEPVAIEHAPAPAASVEPPAALIPPPPPPPPAPPSPPRELYVRNDGVDVSGSLPRADVMRAIDRAWPAIARCTPGSPGTVVAHFTIGEARRAQGVRAAGSAAETNACVVAALADVRTEAAPDVGDVEVTVRIAFMVKV